MLPFRIMDTVSDSSINSGFIGTWLHWYCLVFRHCYFHGHSYFVFCSDYCIVIITGDLESTAENPWSKYLLNSKFEEDLEKEFMGRYKGIPEVIDIIKF